MSGRNVEDVKMRLKLEKGRQFKKGVDDAGKSVRGLGTKSDEAAARMRRLSKQTARFNEIGQRVRQTAILGGVALASMGAFGIKKAIDNASNLNEEINKTNVIFGKSSGVIKAFAADSAKALGMSKTEAFGFAGQIGGMFKSAGKGAAEAAKLSTSVVGLSSDLASFFNANPDEAFLALRSGLSGESEPLRRFNVFLNDAAVKAEGLKMGLVHGKEAMTDGQKVMARYSLIMKATKDAQGDFARTSAGLANQKRILKARVTDLSAKLGTKLLPMVNNGTLALNKFIDGMENGTGAGGAFIKKAQAAGKAIDRYVIKPLGKAAAWIRKSKDRTTAFAIGLGVMTAAMIAFGVATALAASPVYLVVAAIGLLAAGFYYAYQRSETFRKVVGVAWDVLKHVPAIEVVRHLGDIIDFIEKMPGRVSRAASGLWDGFKGGLVGVLNWVIGKINWLIRAFNNTAGRIPGVDNIGEMGKIDPGPSKADLAGIKNAPSAKQRGAESKSGANGRGMARAATASPAGGSSVHVYLDSSEVGSRVLKRTRDRARRR